jgi:hypothetical protein
MSLWWMFGHSIASAFVPPEMLPRKLPHYNLPRYPLPHGYQEEVGHQMSMLPELAKSFGQILAATVRTVEEEEEETWDQA